MVEQKSEWLYGYRQRYFSHCSVQLSIMKKYEDEILNWHWLSQSKIEEEEEGTTQYKQVPWYSHSFAHLLQALQQS